MSCNPLTWSEERFSMLKVPGALTCKRERNLGKGIILNRKFVAVLRNVPIFQRRLFPSTRLVLGSRVPSS